MNERKADFILKGEEILYPAIVKDGLELYYDVRGKTNQDARKNVILDMSGKGRNATLTGFDYKGNSGHAEGLVFDERDDKLNRPAISGLDPNNLTFQINGNIVRFKADGTSQMVQDGQVVEIGRNLIKNSGVSVTGNGYALQSYYFSNISDMIPGETYTVTVEGALSEGQTSWYVNVYCANPTSYPAIGTLGPTDKVSETKWVKTFPMPTFASGQNYTGQSSLYSTPLANGLAATVYRIKIERGSVATPWTPAPEDLIANLAYPNNVLGDLEDVIDDMDINRVTDTSVALSNLKDNDVEVTVSGNTVQQSDWYAKEGLSSQVQSVWATNLVTNGDFSQGTDDWRFSNAGTPTISDGVVSFTPTGFPPSTSTQKHIYKLFDFVVGKHYYGKAKVCGKTTVKLMTTTQTLGVITQEDTFEELSGVWVSTITGGRAFGVVDTATSGCTETKVDNILFLCLTVIFGAGNEPSKETMDKLLEEFPNSWFDGKSLLTTDSRFAPNSPSPEYPSPITSNLPAGTYKYTSTDGIYEFTLDEELRGIGASVDRIVFDRTSKTGKLERRVGKVVFNGTEAWAFDLERTNTARIYIEYSGGLTGGEKFYPYTGIPILKVSHFEVVNWVSNANLDTEIASRSTVFILRINKNRISGYSSATTNAEKLALIKTWLVTQYNQGTPVTVYFGLANPTRTPLTFTKVPSSTKTEVPMTFFTSTPSLEYPAQVWDAGGKVVSRGKNLFDKNRNPNEVKSNGVSFELKNILEVGKKYTLSGSGGVYTKVSLAQSSNDQVLNYNKTTPRTFTWTQVAKDGNYKLYFWKSDISDMDIQIEEGSVATSYEPYQPIVNTTLPTLRKIGF